ncbi:uncharacterized protein [Parasteatoda tepidariorum]|uniref:uncharacterized protein n=1 Tax=Parasteatoda tepidariorum TaxID=114398 RepID=UPI00077FCD93|nr:uncharacterized protein LOC107439408 [Parasteatoda tepidariorum]
MPDAPDLSEDIELGSSEAEDDRYFHLLLAGFRACAKEAIRFLLEEEGLAPDHPLPAGLNEHLVKQQSHLAEVLHNDSGVALEESFLNSSQDGDTTREERDNLEHFVEKSDDKMCICESSESQQEVSDIVEQTLSFIQNQIESDYRTETFKMSD